MVVLGASLLQSTGLLTFSLPHPRRSPARHSLQPDEVHKCSATVLPSLARILTRSGCW